MKVLMKLCMVSVCILLVATGCGGETASSSAESTTQDPEFREIIYDEHDPEIQEIFPTVLLQIDRINNDPDIPFTFGGLAGRLKEDNNVIVLSYTSQGAFGLDTTVLVIRYFETLSNITKLEHSGSDIGLWRALIIDEEEEVFITVETADALTYHIRCLNGKKRINEVFDCADNELEERIKKTQVFVV